MILGPLPSYSLLIVVTTRFPLKNQMYFIIVFYLQGWSIACMNQQLMFCTLINVML